MPPPLLLAALFLDELPMRELNRHTAFTQGWSCHPSTDEGRSSQFHDADFPHDERSHSALPGMSRICKPFSLNFPSSLAHTLRRSTVGEASKRGLFHSGETMAGAEMNLWVSPDGAAFAANKLFIFDWEALAHPSSRADEERGSSPPRGC